MIAGLLERMRQGDRNALARLLSLAARGEHIAELQVALLPSPLRGKGAGGEGSASADASAPSTMTPLPQRGEGKVVAFTGSAGVGKSTLIGKLIPLVRAENHRVAVLACDPQSPVSGGALLGDRFRMGSPTDDGVFIRSLAALSGSGAVADHLDVMIRLLDEFGFDVIFVETVGSGQGDVAVRNLADVVVLLLQPETGDDVQWEKAGILECADIVVVHKADMPSADETAAQVRAALDLSPARTVPVLRVSTKANTGHAELWQAIQALPTRRAAVSAAQILVQLAIQSLQQRFRAAEARRDPELINIGERWQAGVLGDAAAITAIVGFLNGLEFRLQPGVSA